MSEAAFDDLVEVYDALVDWPKRLANEGPFFRRLFEGHNVRRVADVACGTGRHAALFHSWGLEVQGLDVNAGMILRAKEMFGEPVGLRWTVQGFDQPMGPAGSFDAMVCIGNSLALAPDTATAARALGHMFQATRAGGLVITHVLNLWKLPDGPCVWQKIAKATLATGRKLVLKGVHRCANKGYVECVVASQEPEDASMGSHSVPFLGLKAEDFDAVARACAAAEVMFFGNHQNQLYDVGNSTDLIMVARKG